MSLCTLSTEFLHTHLQRNATMEAFQRDYFDQLDLSLNRRISTEELNHIVDFLTKHINDILYVLKEHCVHDLNDFCVSCDIQSICDRLNCLHESCDMNVSECLSIETILFILEILQHNSVFFSDFESPKVLPDKNSKASLIWNTWVNFKSQQDQKDKKNQKDAANYVKRLPIHILRKDYLNRSISDHSENSIQDKFHNKKHRLRRDTNLESLSELQDFDKSSTQEILPMNSLNLLDSLSSMPYYASTMMNHSKLPRKPICYKHSKYSQLQLNSQHMSHASLDRYDATQSINDNMNGFCVNNSKYNYSLNASMIHEFNESNESNETNLMSMNKNETKSEFHFKYLMKTTNNLSNFSSSTSSRNSHHCESNELRTCVNFEDSHKSSFLNSHTLDNTIELDSLRTATVVENNISIPKLIHLLNKENPNYGSNNEINLSSIKISIFGNQNFVNNILNEFIVENIQNEDNRDNYDQTDEKNDDFQDKDSVEDEDNQEGQDEDNEENDNDEQDEEQDEEKDDEQDENINQDENDDQDEENEQNDDQYQDDGDESDTDNLSNEDNEENEDDDNQSEDSNEAEDAENTPISNGNLEHNLLQDSEKMDVDSLEDDELRIDDGDEEMEETNEEKQNSQPISKVTQKPPLRVRKKKIKPIQEENINKHNTKEKRTRSRDRNNSKRSTRESSSNSKKKSRESSSRSRSKSKKERKRLIVEDEDSSPEITPLVQKKDVLTETIDTWAETLISMKTDTRYLGQIIWAKVKGYPNWPAKVTEVKGNRLYVSFYGETSTSRLYPKDTQSFKVNEAKRQLERYQKRSNSDPSREKREMFQHLCQGIKIALEEYAGNADTCCVCHESGFLICCDGCSNACHLECAGLSDVPDENTQWFCFQCKESGVDGKELSQRRTDATQILKENDETISEFQFYQRRDPLIDIIDRYNWNMLYGGSRDRKRKFEEIDDEHWKNFRRQYAKKKAVSKRTQRAKRRRLGNKEEEEEINPYIPSTRITKSVINLDVKSMKEERTINDENLEIFGKKPFSGQKIVRWYWENEKDYQLFFPSFSNEDIEILKFDELWDQLKLEDSRFTSDLCDLRYWCDISKGWVLIRQSWEHNFHTHPVLTLRMTSKHNSNAPHIYSGTEYLNYLR